LSFTPSKYQGAIFNWLVNGSGNAIVNAVAGSGKTTTLVEGSKLIQSNSMLFAAFNSHIVKELKRRLPSNVICKTIHSIGRGCLVRKFQTQEIKVQEFKYRPYCINASKQVHETLLTQYNNLLASFNLQNPELEIPDPPPKVEAIQEQLEDLVNLIRCTLTDVEDLEAVQSLVDHFAIDCPVPVEKILYVVEHILNTGEREALDSNYIDFTDMLWLPAKWKLSPAAFDWILVDEAQDLNAAQLSLIKKMAHADTRILFVGDPCQAIYGFSGADANSFENIKLSCDAEEFPLSICYRCPTKVVELAKEIVSTIEPSPDSPAGEVLSIKETDIIAHLRDGDLILCRSTEPLVRTCFKLLAKKINAAIKGKDIRKSLVGIVKNVEELDNFDYKRFPEFLTSYAEEKARKLKQKPHSERKLIELSDQVASIEVCYTSFNALTLQKFIEDLESLFAAENASIILSTIHKAKGLEENRVYILYPEKLPLKWIKQREWQLQQEINLKYVGLTRAKESLTLVAEVPTL
jgi:DNA helicase-2/ATP-dependent DNA helicase PcrA